MLGLLSSMAFVLFIGCSSFNREWREAGQAPAPPDSITGRWEGRWISHGNGHIGALRRVIKPETNSISPAHFRATYLKMARFGYSVPLEVSNSNGLWHFQGQEDLGAVAGGVYRYEGFAKAKNFEAIYTSKHDHGVFQMQRAE